MSRESLLELLRMYVPEDPKEVGDRELFLQFVHRYEECFDRSLEVGHVTASSWLLNRLGSHALLMHHRKMDDWLQLGGHCDGNPDVLAVAIKEAQEESGILDIVPLDTSIFDLDVHVVPVHGVERAHMHYDVRFLLQVRGEERLIPNHESKAFLWVGREDPLPTQNPSIARMFWKWMNIYKTIPKVGI